MKLIPNKQKTRQACLRAAYWFAVRRRAMLVQIAAIALLIVFALGVVSLWQGVWGLPVAKSLMLRGIALCVVCFAFGLQLLVLFAGFCWLIAQDKKDA